jgi:uncharacterized membrane protein
MRSGIPPRPAPKVPYLLARLGVAALLAGCGAGTTPVAVTAPPVTVEPPVTAPQPAPAPAPTLFDQVRAIVALRCVACHSATPTMPGFSAAPRGIRFDTPEQIHADAQRIYYNVVTTEFMPYGNQTRMTPEERRVIAAWFEGGAK